MAPEETGEDNEGMSTPKKVVTGAAVGLVARSPGELAAVAIHVERDDRGSLLGCAIEETPTCLYGELRDGVEGGQPFGMVEVKLVHHGVREVEESLPGRADRDHEGRQRRGRAGC